MILACATEVRVLVFKLDILQCIQRVRFYWLCLLTFQIDISGANIAFSCKGLWHVPEETLFEVIGSPQVVPLERCDEIPLNKRLPKELLECAHWNEYSGEEEDDIRLIEFGESFLHGEEPAVLNQPRHLRCPETIIAETFNYRVDLWRTGCFVSAITFPRISLVHRTYAN